MLLLASEKFVFTFQSHVAPYFYNHIMTNYDSTAYNLLIKQPSISISSKFRFRFLSSLRRVMTLRIQHQ